MQLKTQSESEQRDFEEDIRWVRDSDQSVDTMEQLTGNKNTYFEINLKMFI